MERLGEQRLIRDELLLKNDDKYELVCSKCNKVFVNCVEASFTSIAQAGYCNNHPCNGKLEWKKC